MDFWKVIYENFEENIHFITNKHIYIYGQRHFEVFRRHFTYCKGLFCL